MSDDIKRFVVIETITERRVWHVDAVDTGDAIAIVQISRGEIFRERQPSPTGPRARARARIKKRKKLHTDRRWMAIDLLKEVEELREGEPETALPIWSSKAESR